jgi:hypothetical protein
MSSDRLRFVPSTRSGIHHLVLAVTCAAFIVLSLSAEAADVVVWWEKGFYAQEDEASPISSPRSSTRPEN